jgi:hypothetical protein
MGLSGMAGRMAALPRGTVEGLLAAPELARAGLAEGQRLLGRLGDAVSGVELLLDRTAILLDDVASLVRAVAVSREHAQAVIDAGGALSADASAALALMTEQTRRVQRLLDDYEPVLREAMPTVQQAAVVLSPEHLRALGHVLDRLPTFLDLIEPALRNLAHLTPELQEVTDRVETVGEIVEGLPGAGMLRRRAQNKEQTD